MYLQAGAYLRTTRAGATLFASVCITIMMVAATALIGDHISLVDQRATLKNASDAAAIAATIEMSRLDSGLADTVVEDKLEDLAERYILINLGHLSPDRYDTAKRTLAIEVNADRAARTVEIDAEADLGGAIITQTLPRLFDGLTIGKTKASTGVESAVRQVEVVLALDVTFSMKVPLARQPGTPITTKIDIVKQAAKELVDTLNPDGTKPAAVGLVPWVNQVRLHWTMQDKWKSEGWAVMPGSLEYPDPWRQTDGKSPAPITQTLPADPGESWEGCLQHRSLAGNDPPGINATHPTDAPLYQGFFAPRPETAYQCEAKPFPAKYDTQNCYDPSSVIDPIVRDRKWKRIGGSQGAWRKKQIGCSGMPTMLGLATDKQTIVNAINALQPQVGLTYSTLGLIWGLRMLTPEWRSVWGHPKHPIGPGEVGYDGMLKAIILLTDGADNWAERGIGVSRDKVCKKAKDAGIEVYIVAAMNSQDLADEAASLKACATQSSDPSRQYAFINNTTNADLMNAFREITTQLMTLRRTH